MTNKDINVPINDCISRAEAIDDLHGKDPSQIWDTADIEVWVNALPSAQPEQRWIPCSARLPFDAGYYLTTTTYNEVFCDYWNLNEWNRTEQVIAWMPLPKPYKEDDHETD